MTVASLDVCKELYELSGWDGTDNYYTPDGQLFSVFINSGTERYPAYDSGFLLRKLPQIDNEAFHHFLPHLEQNRDKSWSAYLECDTAFDHGEYKAYKVAGSPENALCKLAIALFKAGVLKRGEA